MPDILTEPRDHPTMLIRNEPMQARSTARLAALLDAAAAVVAEIGYERLTTAMVAEGAGASIGTVYRYFPDRIAVLQSLAARNEERATDRVLAAVDDPAHADWLAALSASFDVFVGLFRTEPGFASLRLGDVLDLRPAEGTPRNSVMASAIFDALASRFGLPEESELRAAFEVAIEATDALVARAFARDAHGDAARLDAARRAVAAIIAESLPLPPR
ncbi:TetR/AcrR family transcriptional regulator [Protaetiibacter intestinalis]|uniref:TetR/AcrR family transcriptional regulator n=1 Tax=Protaetiibacter intestinalis TaxID=2419774 RepID=A0A387B0B2_9MICO|nr:TetR/AcrR family transcriptional regulator [Protaetiibacter intestinalis]AYF96892.1 TetR/AcrR family transcriptional regulator [Protaetiibacter intestinalis]